MAVRDDVIYRVNDQDEIVFVNAAWDQFAASNGGENLLAPQILHRSLWDFIQDLTTSDLYRRILHRARTVGPVRFTLRCDSPSSRRLLAMHVLGGGDGAVEFRTTTLREEPRAAVSLMTAARSDPAAILCMCGWCQKVQVGSSWEEVEVAVQRLHLFDNTHLPAVTHGICPSCYQAMLQTLQPSAR